jgi:hypothetical protein
MHENSFQLYRKTQRDATYQNQVKISSFLELQACRFCDFHYIYHHGYCQTLKLYEGYVL